MIDTRHWRKLISKPSGYLTVAVVAIYLAMGVAFEIHSVHSRATGTAAVYNRIDENHYHEAPSRRHWLGTDYMGRDVLWRAMAGSSGAMKVGTISGLIAIAIGVALGSAAGYKGGFCDDVVVWLYSVFASIPSLLFILAFALLFSRGFMPPEAMRWIAAACSALNVEPGILAIYVAIGLTGWVTICRVIRAETMKLRKTGYVEAAKVSGIHTPVIIARHIIPNLMHLIVVYFTLSFAGAIMLEVIVSYLGLGVQSAPSWGMMISDGQQRLWRGDWWEITAATGFMFVLVLSLNILGDAIRDAFDPKSA